MIPPSPTPFPPSIPTHPLLTSTPTPPLYAFPIQPPDVASFLCGHHDYPATDIQTPVGSIFVAVTSGTIDWVNLEDGWDGAVDDPATRGGLAVAMIGDDGVRYYGSHLSAVASGIEPGVRVSVSQVLGLTGTSGNGRGTNPHLHFGISHPTMPNDWQVRRGEIDPCPYLKAWLAGEVLTPDLER